MLKTKFKSLPASLRPVIYFQIDLLENLIPNLTFMVSRKMVPEYVELLPRHLMNPQPSGYC